MAVPRLHGEEILSFADVLDTTAWSKSVVGTYKTTPTGAGE